MNIANCPADVLITTAGFLEKRALLHLRLVNRQLHDIVTPSALRAVRFDLDYSYNADPNAINTRLEKCQIPSSDLQSYAQNLTISINGGCLSRLTNPTLLPHLWNTLASFRSLRSFDLCWDSPTQRRSITPAVQTALAKTVDAVVQATGGEIQHLRLSPSPTEPWLSESDSLSSIHGLQTLKVAVDPRGWRCTVHSLQPRLFTDVELQRGYQSLPCGCKPLPVQETLAHILEGNPQLETLEILRGCRGRGFDLHEILLPNLSHLVSLTILGASFHDHSSATTTTLLNPIPLRNLRHLTVYSRYSMANLDVLWLSMKAAGTCLETLTTYQVSCPLMEYLASFSGLRALSIDHIQRYNACVTPEAASLFTRVVLPRHASTLESLSLRFDTDICHIDAWAFNPLTWAHALPRMIALKSLSVHPPRISGEGFVRASDYLVYPYLLENYQALLDSVQDIPNLHRLEVLFPSILLSYVGGQLKWRDSFESVLNKVVPELKIDGKAGSRGVSPDMLVLYNGDFEPVRGEDGRWGLGRVKVDDSR